MDYSAPTLIAVACTLAIYTILWRENPIYRTFEYLFVGVAAGYTVSLIWRTVLYPKWWVPVFQEGRWYAVFPLLLGCLYFTMYTKRYAWLSRLLIVTLMGLSAGLGIQGAASQYFPQIRAAFRPVWQPGYSVLQMLNATISLVTLVSVMTYFFFSFERKSKAVQATASLGRWLLMVSLGATFGATVMARMMLAVSRFDFLINGWLGLNRTP
ncbi:MAG TPA: hypothetical protein VGN26_15135 [Armatimonadota bacterium]